MERLICQDLLLYLDGRSERKSLFLPDYASDAFFVHGEDGCVLEVNRQACESLGYSREELLGMHPVDFDTEIDAAKFQQIQRRIVMDGSVTFESRHRRRDGGVIPVDVHIRAMHCAGRRLSLAVVRDITERKRAEMALHESEEMYRHAFEHAAIGMAITALDGTWLRCNRTLCMMLGYSENELMSMSFAELTHPDDLSENRELAARLLGGEMASIQMEKRYRRRDGSYVCARLTASLVRDELGEPIHYVSQIEDISEHRELEEKLRQSQKLEAVGQLAGGIAHDFNNILLAIQLYVDFAGMSENLSEPIAESLREITHSTERAAALVQQLLLFSQRRKIAPQELDVNDAVTRLANMLQRIIGEDIELQLHLHPDPLVVHADRGMIEQMLLNLALNARDAMPNGGHLVIETGEKTVDRGFPIALGDIAPGRYARFSVRDTGSGIPPAVLPRIFEPFFTTKEPGKGTGLGLATVFGIVKQHRGWIDVDSREGLGADFRVYLPTCAVSSVTQRAEEPLPKPRGGRETILLVEDDEVIRRGARALLERNGYRVLAAASAIDALIVWRTHRDEVELVISDMVMPGGMSGLQLAQLLRGEIPKLKVILTSGYSSRTIDHGACDGEMFLEKPFTSANLLSTIRTCLDQLQKPMCDASSPCR